MQNENTRKLMQDFNSIWKSYHKLIVAFTIALIVDTITTIHFIRITGPEAEIHLLVRAAAYAYGPVFGPIIAACFKFISAFIVVLYWKWIAPVLFTAATVLYIFAGFYNTFAVDMYLQGMVSWLPF